MTSKRDYFDESKYWHHHHQHYHQFNINNTQHINIQLREMNEKFVFFLFILSLPCRARWTRRKRWKKKLSIQALVIRLACLSLLACAKNAITNERTKIKSISSHIHPWIMFIDPLRAIDEECNIEYDYSVLFCRS